MARLLHIAPFPFPAPFGSQVYAAGLAAAQAASGHEVWLACYAAGEGPPPSGVQLVRGRFGGMSRGPAAAKPLADASLVRRIRALQSRVSFDALLGHNVEGAWLSRLARRGPSRLYMQHTRMAEELPDWLGHPRWSAPLGRAVDWLAKGATHRTVGLSLRGDGDVVVPPGVSLDDLCGAQPDRVFARLPAGWRPDVVYVGNTDAYQDLDDLFDAVCLAGLRLLVVTGDPAGPVSAQAAGRGLHDLVVLEDPRFETHRDALATATVAAIPRRAAAGFPMKLLNQLGLGVATVGTTGALPDIAGVVRVAPGDMTALALALSTLVADPAHAEHLGRLGRQEVARAWTWQARAAELDRVMGWTVSR